MLAHLVCPRNRRASLQQALFALCNTLGASGIASDGECLEAGEHIVADVDTFLLSSVVRGEIPLPFDYCEIDQFREVRPIPVAGVRVVVRR